MKARVTVKSEAATHLRAGEATNAEGRTAPAVRRHAELLAHMWLFSQAGFLMYKAKSYF